MSHSGGSSGPTNNWAAVIVALIGLVGGLVVAVIGLYGGQRAATEIAIAATQTAEAKQTAAAQANSIASGGDGFSQDDEDAQDAPAASEPVEPPAAELAIDTPVPPTPRPTAADVLLPPTAPVPEGEEPEVATASTVLSATAMQAPTAAPSDCTSVVTTSRPTEPQQSGESCWLRLYDGAATRIQFHQVAQVTFSSINVAGNIVFFFIAQPGDVLTDVKGATIRPLPMVIRHYGSLENVKQFEIAYHSPGFAGGWVACLKDANNDNAPLNSVCQ